MNIEQEMSSCKVAKMMEVNHKHLLEKIDVINRDLVAENSATVTYIESIEILVSKPYPGGV